MATDTLTALPHNGHYQRSDFNPREADTCLSRVDDCENHEVAVAARLTVADGCGLRQRPEDLEDGKGEL